MMEDATKIKYELKKTLAHLRGMHGSGTELISVYIPAKGAIHEMSGKLNEEAGQATNIKSKSTRTNVGMALAKIIHHLKTYGHQAPQSGVAIFCGNVSDNQSKSDIQLFTVYPSEPISVQIYRCDSRFFLEPLERMVDVKDSYGLVVLDGRECTLATLRGTNITVLHRLNSTAHAKIRKGGQCLAPDTMVFGTDGSLVRVADVAAGTRIKGADLAGMEIGDWTCSDRFFTRSKSAFRIVTHAPKMEITATAWHRFFTITEHGVREIYAKDLKIGSRVLVAKKVGHEGCEVPVEYRPTRGISLDYAEYEKLRKRRAGLGWSQEKTAQKLGVTQMAVCRMERGEIPLSAGKIREMYKLYGLELDEGKFADFALKLPKTYTPDLAYILGAIAGDGTLDGNRVIIYESYPEIGAKYFELIERTLGIKALKRVVDKRGQKGSFAKKEYFELRVYSKEFADFVAAEVPQVVAESEVRGIPGQILKSRPEVQTAFLSGLYDAEGYMHGKRVEIAMVSQGMMRQVHAVLLRLGIRASLGGKTVKGNPQWCVSISDLQSLKKYEKEIGFSREDKKLALQKAASRIGKMQFVEQVMVDGREVCAYAKSLGLKTSDFHAASCFFRNVKPLGREAFVRNVASVIRKRAVSLGKTGEAEKMLMKWLSEDVGVARVAELVPIEGERDYVDLTVPNAFNFVANGFIVHNSARRYERLIEESIELYYKRVGEYMDRYYVNSVKGVIIGGPGPTKDNFVKMSPFNYQIKVLGVVDTGYTEETGLRELMGKSGDIIGEQEAVKERQLIDRFMREVVSGSLAIYGEAPVREALMIGKAGTLLVSEGLKWKRYKTVCNSCKEEKDTNVKEGGEKPSVCGKCGGKLSAVSEADLIDDLIALAEKGNIKIEIVSSDTSEGAQFLQSFYGVGAFVRYR